MDETMYYKHDHSGQRATGIGLAAGLGGGALIAAILGWVANNEASKARNAGTMALAAANAAGLGQVRQDIFAERNSRENWQNANTPSIQSYIDVQATPTSQSTASSLAEAYSLASAIANNNGLNGAVSTDSFLKVASYSAPQPCGCNG